MERSEEGGANLNRKLFKDYLKLLFEVLQRGDAREESFYPALKEFLSDYAEATGRSGIHVTAQPKKTEAGNPDFRVWDGEQHIIGYIEAKAPDEGNLARIATTEQLKRYRGTFPNLILTDFTEFHLFRNGELVDSVQIARPLKVPPLEHADQFAEFLSKFFSFSLPKLYSAESLATELAVRTRFLRDEVVAQELVQEKEKGTGDLLGHSRSTSSAG